MDGTIFKHIDTQVISDELEKLGYDPYGEHRMINGVTGEYIDKTDHRAI